MQVSGERSGNGAAADIARTDEQQRRAGPIRPTRAGKRWGNHARNRRYGVVLADDTSAKRRLEIGNLGTHRPPRRRPPRDHGRSRARQTASGRESAHQKSRVDALDSQRFSHARVDRIQQRARDGGGRRPGPAAPGALEDALGAQRDAKRPASRRPNRPAGIPSKVPSQPDRIDPARSDSLLDDPVTEAKHAYQEVERLNRLRSSARRLGNGQVERVADVVTVGHGAASRADAGA
jgi:hypothetical protein